MTSPQEHTIEDTLRDLLEIYESTLAELLTVASNEEIDFATSHLTPGATSAILVHPRNHDALLWGIAKQHLDSSGPTEADILITTTYREPTNPSSTCSQPTADTTDTQGSNQVRPNSIG